ncbi:MAG: hypothetical protein ABI969_17615 [bacterium]
MILFAQNNSSGAGWRQQIVAALPGMLVGIGLSVALHWTSLTPAVRVLLSSLPMWFLLAWRSPFAGKPMSASWRVRRAAVIAVVVSTLMYGIVLLA